MRARSVSSLGLGLLVLVALSSAAAAKPKIAILGLEVIGSTDPEQVKIAKQLTNGLRERAGAGTGPYELAPNSDKELADEKLMNNCGTEATVCMVPIGQAMRADYLMFGNVEKVDKGYHITIKLIRVASKMPLPTYSEIVSIADVKTDPKGVARRAYAKMTSPDEGTVTVRVANADRATVYVDDQPKGTTTSGVLTFSVPAGKHRLAVVANEKGWNRYEQELAISAGDQRNLPVELTRGGGTAAGSGQKPPPGDGGRSTELGHETTGVASSSGRSGSGAWSGLAIGGAIVTVGLAVGFSVSLFKLYGIGKADGDTRSSPFAFSCPREEKDTERCKNGELYQNISWGTGIGTAVLAGFTMYAFFRGAGSSKERPATAGRSARPRRELTVTPVVSTSGGGAALRFDW